MPLEKVGSILREADKSNCGVIAFNVFNYESIAWAIETAEEEQVPVIISLHPFMFSHIKPSTCFEITKDMASGKKTAIGIHLDHSETFDEIMSAIKAGFTSVMIDGSAKDFDENVQITKEVVKTAHAFGVDVEAELGRVGKASNINDLNNEDYFTGPKKAAEFVDLTGVDSLAVAIGNAHGNYISTPKLDLKRLEAINKAVNVPLVLHGGSGIPEQQLKEASKLGINKLNIATEFLQEFYILTKAIMDKKRTKENMLLCMLLLKTDMKEYIRKKIHSMGF